MSLKDVLSHPRIWQGRDTGHLRPAAVPTGFDRLDEYLPGGGWPLGAITEVFIERYGIGELSLLMPALSSLSVSEVRQWIVWIAPPFIPYAPALHRCGLDLNRVLLVHPSSRDPQNGRSGGDVLWATEQAIRSRSSAVALAWLETADATALRRMQLGAEENACWAVLFRPLAALSESSPAALRLKLSRVAMPAGSAVAESRDTARIEIIKCRGRWPITISLENVMLRARRPDAGKPVTDERGQDFPGGRPGWP